MKDLAAIEAFALQFHNKSRCRTLTAEAKKVAAGRESVLKSFTTLTESQVGLCLCINVICVLILGHFPKITPALYGLPSNSLPSLIVLSFLHIAYKPSLFLADEEESKRAERVG